MKHVLLLTWTTVFTSSLVYGQGGTLDLSFNGTGFVTTAVGNGDDNASVLVVQPDGKILVAGDYHSGLSADVAIVRYLDDGSIDAGFGQNGLFTYAINTGYYETVKALLLGADGKITAVGYFFSPSFTFDIFLLRIHADGTVDNTFGTNGLLTFGIGSGSDIANAAVLQPDGKMVLTGYYDNSGNIDMFALRLNYDGTTDATFGAGTGLVSIPIGSKEDYAQAIALQSDGKIVLAGKAVIGSGTDIAVVRLNTDGSLDATFSADGKVTLNVNGNDSGNAVAIQSDGAIVVAGEAFDGSSYNVAVVRFTASGNADNTFSGDGKVSTAVGSYYDGGFAVGLHASGKILVAGTYNGPANDDLVVLRYLSNGTLDPSFNGNGMAKFDFGFNDAAFALHILPNGRVLLAGKATNGSNADFLLARMFSEFGVGISTSDHPSHSKLFPNPASDYLWLFLNKTQDAPAILRIIDVKGSVFHQSHILSSQSDRKWIQVDIPKDLPAGNYVLQIVQNHRLLMYAPLVVNR